MHTRNPLITNPQVTLLLMNAACNEALPLFLDNLMDPATTVIVSVTAVLLFGEIIPQVKWGFCCVFGHGGVRVQFVSPLDMSNLT